MISDNFSREIALKFVYQYKFHRNFEQYTSQNTHISWEQGHPYRDEEMELTDALRAINDRFGKGDYLRNSLDADDILLLVYCNGELLLMENLLRSWRSNAWQRFFQDSNQIQLQTTNSNSNNITLSWSTVVLTKNPVELFCRVGILSNHNDG